jgi:hypothetical protein
VSCAAIADRWQLPLKGLIAYNHQLVTTSGRKITGTSKLEARTAVWIPDVHLAREGETLESIAT